MLEKYLPAIIYFGGSFIGAPLLLWLIKPFLKRSV